ncbi:hypothetical protein HN652_03750 [archaeon]|jgi:hypothetical protein|nr:hypothetical protein [archaeon]MBT7508103.1 hypothetical protein [archaeon]
MTPPKKVKKPTRQVKKEKEPGFNVRVNDPKLLRKDILESLREVILFMQSYEHFRTIQDEKMSTFSELRSVSREINTLINGKMRSLFPKGKLSSLREEETDYAKEPMKEVEKTVLGPRKKEKMPVENNELNELESQLKSIESQLQNI